MFWEIEAESGDGKDRMLGIVEAETREQAHEAVRAAWYADGNRILLGKVQIKPVLLGRPSGQVS